MVVRNCGFQPAHHFHFSENKTCFRATQRCRSLQPPRALRSHHGGRALHCSGTMSGCTSPPTAGTFQQQPPSLIKEEPPFLSESVVMLQVPRMCTERQEQLQQEDGQWDAGTATLHFPIASLEAMCALSSV